MTQHPVPFGAKLRKVSQNAGSVLIYEKKRNGEGVLRLACHIIDPELNALCSLRALCRHACACPRVCTSAPCRLRAWLSSSLPMEAWATVGWKYQPNVLLVCTCTVAPGSTVAAGASAACRSACSLESSSLVKSAWTASKPNTCTSFVSVNFCLSKTTQRYMPPPPLLLIF